MKNVDHKYCENKHTEEKEVKHEIRPCQCLRASNKGRYIKH